jgi:1,4-dihydroxy-2-naphthoyl-CoA hydrolase
MPTTQPKDKPPAQSQIESPIQHTASPALWKQTPTLEQLNAMNHGTIHESLGIVFTAIGDQFIEATMPVDSRTHNPRRILHGGASVVLAESLGSVASVLVAGPQEKTAAGLEINASHLNSIQSGKVVGRVTAVRLGRTIHVWDIQIREDSEHNPKPICRSRLTVIIQDSRQDRKT